MSVVRETVEQVIRSNHGQASLGLYQNTVEQVIRALEDGLNQSISVLVEGGTALGASEQQVKELLVDAGLIDEQPETQTAQADSDMDARMRRLETAVQDLSALAAEVRRRRLI